MGGGGGWWQTDRDTGQSLLYLTTFKASNFHKSGIPNKGDLCQMLIALASFTACVRVCVWIRVWRSIWWCSLKTTNRREQDSPDTAAAVLSQRWLMRSCAADNGWLCPPTARQRRPIIPPAAVSVLTWLLLHTFNLLKIENQPKKIVGWLKAGDPWHTKCKFSLPALRMTAISAVYW